MPEATISPARIEARNIEKRFGGVHALRRVSVAIVAGSVHALIGENGAGKSTIGRIMAGLIAPDGGAILIGGNPVTFRNPADALRQGVAIVSQELLLVPGLSLSENVYLGIEGSSGWTIFPPRTERADFAELAKQVGLDFPPDYPASRLSVADQQKLEIMRALARNASVIVMDEPTAALGAEDTSRLKQIILRLRRDGKTIIYVSHFLEDVLEIADTITILRDGQLVRTAPASDETQSTLVEAMLGRPLALSFPAKVHTTAQDEPLFVARGLRRDGEFSGIDFTLQAGEILGIAGLVGSGRTEIARAIYGAERLHGGEMMIRGTPYRPRSPAEAIRRGIAMLPESRKDQGLLLLQSIGDNMSLPHLGAFSKGGVLSGGRIRRQVETVMKTLAIKADDPDVVVSRLSGGNQQKVVLGRWMLQPCDILIVDEPTRGVDVGAKAAIYRTLVDLAARGMGIIVISSELEELLGLAHRALVMRAGRCVAELGPDDLNEQAVLTAAFGGER